MTAGVLAVMDRALLLVNDDDDSDGLPFDTDKSAEVHRELSQARADVAELVEAASDPYLLRKRLTGVVGPTNARIDAAHARLKAAVAAVGGAA